MPPISNDDPMSPGMTPNDIARYKAGQEAAQNRAAFQQMQFEDVNKDWLGQADQFRATTPTRGMQREGNAPSYMGQQRTNQTRNWNAQRQVPYDATFDQVAQSRADRQGYLRSLAGDTNWHDPAMRGVVEPMQSRLPAPPNRWNEFWAEQPDKAVGRNFASRYVTSRAKGVPLPPSEVDQAYAAMAKEWAGAPDQPVTKAWSASGMPEDHMAAMKVDPRAPWSAPSDPRMVHGPGYGGEIAAKAPLMGGEASFGPKVGTAVRTSEEMAFGPRAAPAAGAATLGGRAAGAARGAMGMFGGPAAIGAFGVLNNAVDLMDPNSVMRKAIHEGNYGTALARGAVNFVPFGGTVWDVLSGNNHPNQPTVNKPQATDPETPLDLTNAFPGDPLRHGNYTSRQEMMDLYKMQKQFEDKPGTAAAKDYMRILNADLAQAQSRGDEKRMQSTLKAIMDFEHALALGQNSYPYLGMSAMQTPEHEWLGSY